MPSWLITVIVGIAGFIVFGLIEGNARRSYGSIPVVYLVNPRV